MCLPGYQPDIISLGRCRPEILTPLAMRELLLSAISGRGKGINPAASADWAGLIPYMGKEYFFRVTR